MKIEANGIEIEYETFGDKGDPALLLIMGLGAQLTRWPDVFCEMLAAEGFYVVRYDNRDVGLSTKFDHAGVPDMPQIFAWTAKPHYALGDMAADAVSLLDALGVAKAHIVGASMGGMIAQLVAADHPEKTLSLTSIMSTTGNPAVPPATPEAFAVITAPPRIGLPMEEMIDGAVKVFTVFGGPKHDYNSPEERARIRRDIERSNYPEGRARQMAAIVANGDRREKLKTIATPTLVIHGAVDPLVHPEGGRDTAASIEGAELVIVPDMGHDLPPFVFDQVVSEITKVAARA